LFAGKIFLVLNMQYSLDYIGKKIQFFKSFHFYNVSQLGKYIPGNIWHFVGRFGYYKTENLTFTEINRALILEILFIISGSLLIGLFFLLLNQELFFYIGNLYWRYQEVINIFLLVVIFIVFFIIVIKKIFLIKIIRKIFINWRLNVKIFLVQLAVWLFLGTSFYLLIQSYITGFDQYTYSIGLYAISYLIGFLFVFAPAGIGVREFILLSGLNLIDIPFEIKLSMVGFHRFIYITAEIVLAGISSINMIYLKHYNENYKDSKESP